MTITILGLQEILMTKAKVMLSVGFRFGEGSMQTNTYLVAQMVKNLPAMQETLVWSLGWENPLEKGMATHSSILAWGIPWTKEPGRLFGEPASMGSQRVWQNWATNIFTFHTNLVSRW